MERAVIGGDRRSKMELGGDAVIAQRGDGRELMADLWMARMSERGRSELVGRRQVIDGDQAHEGARGDGAIVLLEQRTQLRSSPARAAAISSAAIGTHAGRSFTMSTVSPHASNTASAASSSPGGTPANSVTRPPSNDPRTAGDVIAPTSVPKIVVTGEPQSGWA